MSLNRTPTPVLATSPERQREREAFAAYATSAKNRGAGLALPGLWAAWWDAKTALDAKEREEMNHAAD